MDRKKILVVDDERDLCDILCFNLTVAGYDSEAAYSAEEAWQKIEVATRLDSTRSEKRYSLLLLDVMMPGMSGYELAERLKQEEATAHIPIIFLTAKDTEEDTLRGFSLGADDYVTKPFSVREVTARVKAVLNRTQDDKPPHLTHEGLAIDNTSKTVTIDGDDASLTRTEFDLLYWLLAHQGQVFSRQQLLDNVWPPDVVVTERTVDVTITRMRKKIGPYAACIVARQGFGYCFEVKSETFATAKDI